MAKRVSVGESVILYVNSSKYLFAEVIANKRVKCGKQNIATIEFEGKQYGATYSIDGGKLTQIKSDELLQLKNELAPESEQVPDANNSKLVDDNTSQKLSQSDIAEMKSQGASGKDVIKAIVGNSSTFNTKTDYSKEKYLKKKAKKHITTVQILRGTANSIWTAYYSNDPAKIRSIRGDSLALMLTLSNVSANPDKKVIVAENCQGLILGSVAERMGGLGKIYFANTENSQPSTPAIKSFNFTKQVADSIITFPVNLLNSLLSSPLQDIIIPEQKDTTQDESEISEKELEKRAARARTQEETVALAREGADSLLVVSKYAPQSIVPQLVRALKGGGAFAVFAQQLQPLAETLEFLRAEGVAINMSLAETWLRVHQVLPARTHPHMQMDGASGYILNGVRVLPETQTQTQGIKRKSSEAGDEPEQKATKIE